MLTTNVIGFAYSLLQINCILNFSHYNGKSFNKRDGGSLLDCYGDKVYFFFCFVPLLNVVRYTYHISYNYFFCSADYLFIIFIIIFLFLSIFVSQAKDIVVELTHSHTQSFLKSLGFRGERV